MRPAAFTEMMIATDAEPMSPCAGMADCALQYRGKARRKRHVGELFAQARLNIHCAQ